MLLSLLIKNIVLIDQLELEFEKGFCVLTGETGAGKSILLDSLGLVLGNRAETRLVRSGEKQGTVTGEFDISNNKAAQELLDEQGIDIEDTLLLRRVVYSDGKSKAFANDCSISLNFLQELSSHLIEIHGQHDQRGLLNQSNHLKILDSYGGLDKNRQEVSKLFNDWKESVKEYDKAQALADKAKEEEDYLRHVYDELTKLDPQQGEEEELAELRIFMMNGEKILESLKSAMGELDNSKAGNSLRSAYRILERNSDKAGEKFEPALRALDKASIELNEAVTVIENIAVEVDVDEARLEDAEERLFALKDAARKYKKPVDDLAAYADEVEKQIGLLESQEELLNELRKKAENNLNNYISKSEQLSEKRKKASVRIEKELTKELVPLKMKNSRFKVDIEALENDKWNANGQDKISFLISTNPGSPFGPLGKIASGGELSRFMLALKVVLSGTKFIPTLVFDEIDSGIGGAVADAVGNRLKQLSKNAQILCVTHQPQVASYSTQHFKIDKSEQKNKTTTSVAQLSDQQRKEEVARMLAGAEISDEARAAAHKLMEA